MRLKYDLNVGALYIRLSDEAVAQSREVDDNASVDLDRTGGLVGIEVVSTSHPWPLDAILGAYEVPDGEAAQLRAYFQMQGCGLEAPQVSAKPIPAVPVPA
jgi:uncharacterized protein YuzE